jgi:hypothetical protein
MAVGSRPRIGLHLLSISPDRTGDAERGGRDALLPPSMLSVYHVSAHYAVGPTPPLCRRIDTSDISCALALLAMVW